MTDRHRSVTPLVGFRTPLVDEIVRNDLCIGCGLCEALGGGAVRMQMTDRGSLRPTPTDGLGVDAEAVIGASCPGVVAEARADADERTDEVWGAYRAMTKAWAGEADVRSEGSTGGVLTALGQHLLASGGVAFVLHVGPDPDMPTRSRWVMSEAPDDVRANSGSRYGPTAPLAGLSVALERNEPFALVAKPCDLGAIHRYAAFDERVDRLCVVRLAMVCGGQSRLTKTLGVLDSFGLDEADVTSFRYRGNGNPGPTRIETATGDVHELTYLDMWADESAWDLETRCKLCPDALGECADIAVADAWPGGAPVGEDEGFNAIVVRTTAGAELIESAVTAGRIVIGGEVTPRTFDDFQPHQVRKKVAIAARYEGVAASGARPIATIGLRIDELGRRFNTEAWAEERDGTQRRMMEVRR